MPSQAGQFVTSKDGSRIWADASGNKSGIPVVFTHGLSCTAHVFDKQFSDKALLENLYMIRYETRGHGRSDHPLTPEAYAMERFAEDFMAVCEAFGIVKPFVCGWSLGALTPVDVAETFGPDHIAGVIYPGGPAITLELHKQYIHPTLAENFPTLMVTGSDRVPHAANVFVDSCLFDPQGNLPFENRLQWLAGFLIQPPTVRILAVTRPQTSERWAKEFSHKPHLLVQRRHDKHSQTDKLIPVAKKTLSGIEIKILENVGHAVPWEGAKEFNELLLKFVQRHKAATK